MFRETVKVQICKTTETRQLKAGALNSEPLAIFQFSTSLPWTPCYHLLHHYLLCDTARPALYLGVAPYLTQTVKFMNTLITS